MVKTIYQARAVHARRVAARKQGIGKAVRRFFKRVGYGPSDL